METNDFDIPGPRFAVSLSTPTPPQAIVAGSVMVKVPQILKMKNSNSSEGISSTSNALDLIMVGATLGYGYTKNMPFAAYGDALFVYLQTAIILILIPYYRKNMILTLLFLFLSAGAGYAIFEKLAPLNVITIAQQANIPLTVISRGIQIVTNFGNKSAGQLSGITFFLSFAGCASRIMTSLVDAKDNLRFGKHFLEESFFFLFSQKVCHQNKKNENSLSPSLAMSFAVSTVLNGIIWFQIIYYSKSDKTKKE